MQSAAPVPPAAAPGDFALMRRLTQETIPTIISISAYTTAVIQHGRLQARYSAFEGFFYAIMQLALIFFLEGSIPKATAAAPVSTCANSGDQQQQQSLGRSRDPSNKPATGAQHENLGPVSAPVDAAGEQGYVFVDCLYQPAVVQLIFLTPLRQESTALVGLQLTTLLNSIVSPTLQSGSFGAWVATLPWQLMIVAVLALLAIKR